MSVVIWHNPSCGSSRNALAHLKENGVEPEVYLYIKEKPNADAIQAVLDRLGMTPSELLRPKEAIGEELGVYASDADQDDVLAAMAQHARLIQRPIVLTPKGAVIARPKTMIDDIL